MLKKLLSCKHFYDVESDPEADNIKGSIIKSPVEIVLGTCRLFESEFPANLSAYLKSAENPKSGLINLLIQQGISYYEPFEVAGYPAYHQFPAYNRNWITPYYLVYRYKTADYIVYNSPFEGAVLNINIDILEWTKTNISDPANADTLVSEILNLMVPYDLQKKVPMWGFGKPL